MKENYLDIKSGTVKDIIHEWWLSLLKNRGDGADLRRCHDLTDVFFSPAYHRLYQNLLAEGKVKRDALALIAVSLAYIKSNEPRELFAAQMGEKKSSGSPHVSETRFRKLIRSETYPELFSPVIRIIRLLDGSVNIDDMVNKLYFWNEKTRHTMTFEYYEKVLHYEENLGGKKE